MMPLLCVNHSTLQFLYNYDVLSFPVKRISRVRRLFLRDMALRPIFRIFLYKSVRNTPLYTSITAFAIIASNSMRYS
jgi:hypothetical protein